MGAFIYAVVDAVWIVLHPEKEILWSGRCDVVFLIYYSFTYSFFVSIVDLWVKDEYNDICYIIPVSQGIQFVKDLEEAFHV